MLPDSDYKKLTAPESVAFVGVTKRTGIGSINPLEVLLKRGYWGRIYPVNRQGGSILGYQAYTSLLDVPEIPDLAVICAPRDAVPELFGQCAARGVKIVIITAQGFFDGDERGRLMQEELLDMAAQNSIRVLGPNTLGIVNNYHNFCTSFINFINPVKPIGITCQTGTFYLGASQLCTGIGILVDTGNTTDIDVSDVLGHLARDPRLKVINIHMESLKNGTKFMEAAKDAVPLTPVVIYKTGTSAAGSIAASSHTGSLAGEDKVFDTAFKQCGLFRAADVEEMIDLNKAFCTFNGIKGNRIGIVSISGGAGVMAVDACIRYGLEIAALSKTTFEQLNELFPPWARCGNPMDMWPASMFNGYQYSYRRILEAFMEDPQVDSVICMTGSFLDKEEDFLDVTGVIREIAGKYPDKPIVVSTCGNRYRDYEQELEKDNNVVYYFSLERAARALSALYKYHRLIKKKVYSTAIPVSPGQNPAGKILAGKAAGNLEQTEALKLLESCGIPVVRWEKAKNIEEAVSLAEKIGYPVTMKVISTDIIHKSDVGGVRLNIGNPQQLEEAFTEMHGEIHRRQAGAKIDGVLIQEYLPKGTELLIGCKRDPQFGPVLAFGTGGVFTEILNDVSLRILPLSKEEFMTMINETKAGKILAGARGTTAVNFDMLTDCLASFAQLVMENPSISEMDINPLLAYADRIVALDARVTLGKVN
ncbi:acetate--CoA ligase family protein [Pelotomaculum isophthalicicum JI]|uniref:Acetate--CoA ligase family protein n=1 Tax=Pelotomaculum isophthalicicum JI TaxID=947010 RepID=A0A9X4H3M6_9FIRM|nr:acetate--CoA ligase family protein [Pelotomaculum isophthalicicum]MDF9409756.1 acetate--CoA ligase family protein [Pelotomaculum isophthalicicum JI]